MAQHPIVTNAHEPFGDDVKQEAADELVGASGHDFGSIAPAPIPPPKHHLAIVHRHEPVITERHAMRITSQVRHCVLCGGEGRLGIDDPGLLPQRRKKAQ